MPSDAPDALPPELAALKAAGLDPAQLADPRYRLDHLYTITTDEGRRIPFRLNDAQRLFLDRWWYLSIILKARQLGYTSLLGLIALDQALFIPNFTVGIIAHNLDDVGKIFRRKILEPYEALPEALRAAVPAVKRTESEIVLANGSSISVGMSMRSGTLQMLHVCLSGDTEVLLKDGVARRITEVKPGDLVMTDRGSYQPVKAVVKNRIEDVGHPLFSIKVFGHYAPLKATGNHSILCREHRTGRPVWKQANEIVVGDYVAFPLREPSMALRDGCLPFGAATYSYQAGKRTSNSGRRIPATFDLGFLVGFYLAEGSIRRTETTFAVHRKEVPGVVSLIERFADYFDSYRVYDHKTSLTSTVTVNGKDFAQFLTTFFGAGAEKRIPDAVWNYGRQFLDGLVLGYFSGDGCFLNDRQVQVTSIRRQLIEQMRLLLISLRFGMPTIYRRPAGRFYGRQCKEVWVLKLNGPGNWKFRDHFGLTLPEVHSKSAKWRVAHQQNPEGRKLWRRGANHYWGQVTAVELSEDEPFVYDLALENEPHNYVTVSGVVHNSEFGKIAAQYPEKAREIVTGAFEAVAPGQIIVVESTAEGNGGAFHDMVTKAQQVRDSGRPLTKLDFRLQFFPWYLRPSNTLSDAEASVIPISAEWRRYFEGVERQQRVTLTAGQKAWYVVKAERMGHDDMKRENPSTEAEPFEVAVQGAILAKQMALVRRRHQIGRFPLIPGYPVNTFWDWGLNDDTVILAHQRINGVDRFSWSYANHGEGVEHYAQKLRQTGIEVWGTHYVPHDFDQRRPSLSSPITLADMCRQAGIKPLVVVPRVVSLRYGIQQMRQVLPLCAFDDEDAAELVTALDNYRYEWDDKLAVYRDTPRHDEYSHGASAFMQFALMHEQLRRLGPTPKAPEQQQRERRKESIFDKPRRRRSHMTV